LLWPLAVAELVRETESSSIWLRLHSRQAVVWGSIVIAILVVVLALPLIAVLTIPGISNALTIDIYGAGLALDVVVGLILLAVGIRFAARAARGDLFSIPVVTPLVDRWLRVKRS
jgi:uncharacterized membrane protein